MNSDVRGEEEEETGLLSSSAGGGRGSHFLLHSRWWRSSQSRPTGEVAGLRGSHQPMRSNCNDKKNERVTQRASEHVQKSKFYSNKHSKGLVNSAVTVEKYLEILAAPKCTHVASRACFAFLIGLIKALCQQATACSMKYKNSQTHIWPEVKIFTF